MEMQADVQRAIRQEVSAAIHAADPRSIGSGVGGGVGVVGGVSGVSNVGDVDGAVGGGGAVSDAGGVGISRSGGGQRAVSANNANGGAANAVVQERPTGKLDNWQLND